jgi:hypothetical protein
MNDIQTTATSDETKPKTSKANTWQFETRWIYNILSFLGILAIGAFFIFKLINQDAKH